MHPKIMSNYILLVGVISAVIRNSEPGSLNSTANDLQARKAADRMRKRCLERIGETEVESDSVSLRSIAAYLIRTIDGNRLQASVVPSRLGEAGYCIYAFHAPVVYCLLIFGIPWWLVIWSSVALQCYFFHFSRASFDSFRPPFLWTLCYLKIGRSL
jgi:hypothetical protein